MLGQQERLTVTELADKVGLSISPCHRRVRELERSGAILPLLHDPDGHEIRFYTHEHHTEPGLGNVTTIHDPRETSERRERANA